MKALIFFANLVLMLGAAWRLDAPQILTVALLAYALGSSGRVRLVHAAPWVLIAWILTDLSAMNFDNHLRFRPPAHGLLLLEHGLAGFAVKLAMVLLALGVARVLQWFLYRLTATLLLRNLALLASLLVLVVVLLSASAYLPLPAGGLRVLVTLLTILILRLTQFEEPPRSLAEFFAQALPPIYDPSPFVRHASGTHDTPWVNFASPLATRRLLLFHVLSGTGEVLAMVFFSAAPDLMFPSAAGVLPNLEAIPLPLLHSHPRWSLWLAIFLRGVFFITNVMTVSLLAEAAYAFFGRRLRSAFRFDLRSTSFADFFTGIVPMQAQFIKDVFVYPCLAMLGPRQRPVLAAVTAAGVLLCGTLLNVLKFLDPRQSGSPLENLWRFTQVDLLAYAVIIAGLLLLRGRWARRPRLLIGWNLCYVTLVGIVITLRHRALVVPLAEKFSFFFYLFGGTP